MKFSELEPGDTFHVQGDNRLFMKIFSGMVNINGVILRDPSNVRVGCCVSFGPEHDAHYVGTTQLDYRPQ